MTNNMRWNCHPPPQLWPFNSVVSSKKKSQASVILGLFWASFWPIAIFALPRHVLWEDPQAARPVHCSWLFEAWDLQADHFQENSNQWRSSSGSDPSILFTGMIRNGSASKIWVQKKYEPCNHVLVHWLPLFFHTDLFGWDHCRPLGAATEFQAICWTMRLLCSSMPSCLKSRRQHSWCGKPTAMNLQFGKFYKGPFLVIFGDNVLSGLPQYQLRHGDVSPTGTLLTNKTSKVHNDTAIFCQNNPEQVICVLHSTIQFHGAPEGWHHVPNACASPHLVDLSGAALQGCKADSASYGKLWQVMAYGTAAFTLSGCIGKCIGETISIAVSLCSSCAVGFFQVGLKMIIIENQIDWKSDFFTKCFAAWCFSLRVRCCKLHGCSKVLGWQGAGQTSPVCAVQKEHLPTAIPSPPSIPSRSFSGLWFGRLLWTFSKEPRLISLRHFAGMLNQLSWVTQEGWAGMPGMPRS